MAVVVSGWMTSYAQEAEVPGDHFSLEGALELFKKSSSPEEFEKMLNSPDTKVNNLDLNSDGYIDYVRVHDRHDGNIHAFIIQAVISEDELQDIAVIELEKLSDGKAVLQIIGDEDIYGVTTIIEPTREVRTYAGTQSTRTVVNVWAWPSVQYVYAPYYTAYVSPWGWHHHPVWYSSWRPIAYVHYYPIWRPYHSHYVVCYTRRIVHAHDIYLPYRRTSVIVHRTYHDRVIRYRETYKNGRTRDDGRQYAREDRSRGRSDFQRASDNSGRTRSTVNRESNASRNRPVTRERSANTGRTRDVNQVRNADELRRAEPDKQSVRREQITSRSSENKQEATTQPTTAPEPNRTQPTLRTRPVPETRSTAGERSAPVQRNPQVEQRIQSERSRQPERTQQVQRSREASPRPAAVERASSPSGSAPHRSSEGSSGRTRGRQ